jgi:hypothetical protein
MAKEKYYRPRGRLSHYMQQENSPMADDAFPVR